MKEKWIQALTLIVEFTDEEIDAITGESVMTYEIFSKCVKTCNTVGGNADFIFYHLLQKYPEYVDKEAREIDEEVTFAIKKDDFPVELKERIKRNILREIYREKS